VLFILPSLIFVAGYFYHDAIKLQQKLQVSAGFLLAATVMQVAFWFTASSIWRQIVFLLSSTRLSLLQSYSQLAIVGIGKYLPGKVWGMIARGIQLKKHGVNPEKAFLATFYEQYILLHAGLVLCATLAIFLLPNRFVFLAAVVAVLAVVFGTSVRHYGILGFLYIWQKIRKENLSKCQTDIPVCDYLFLLSKFTLLWVLNGLVFSGLYFTFFNSPLDIKLVAMMVLANTVGITVGFFALFAPGGIGVRELFSSAILAHVLSLSDAALLSLIYRLWVIAMEMLSGIAILPIATDSAVKKQ